MNKSEASRLAQTVTLDDLRAMFKVAQEHVTDWTAASRLNSQISKGAAFNILSAGIASADRVGDVAKRNMICEFGEYLPGYKKPNKRRTSKSQRLHQEPCFIDFRSDLSGWADRT
jgi:hypothetical protein